jgi:hypothetical protein
MADDHLMVLGPQGELRMAHPFSAVPSDFQVISGDRRWYANCIWDALSIPSLVEADDADIHTHCGHSGLPLKIEIREGQLIPVETLVHFALPAREWWEDIFFA